MEYKVKRQQASKQEIKDKVEHIIADFNAQLSESDELTTEMNYCMRIFNSFLSESTSFVKLRLDDLAVDLQSLQKKSNKAKRTYTLDEIVLLTKKYRTELAAFKSSFEVLTVIESEAIGIFKFFRDSSRKQQPGAAAFHDRAQISLMP